jgi:hypothetical protein
MLPIIRPTTGKPILNPVFSEMMRIDLPGSDCMVFAPVSKLEIDGISDFEADGEGAHVPFRLNER